MKNPKLVSILTPTYNRRRFIPQYLHNIKHQDYKGNIEIIILDDGIDNISDLIPNDERFKYIKINSKQPIGYKRNFLCHEARGDILIHMDDDDYYPPQRISHAVETLTNARDEALIAGSSLIYFYDKNLGIRQFGKINLERGYHAHAGTFAFFKEYLETNQFDDQALKGEELIFTHHFTNPLSQLNPLKTVLVTSHNNNTVPKTKLMGIETPYTIEQFIKDSRACHFYKTL